MEVSDLPKKTPKNLTNNKLPDSDEDKEVVKQSSPTEDIEDETPNRDGDNFDKTGEQVYIEDFYDENQSDKIKVEQADSETNDD